jgi:hypothetical protein
MNVHTEARKIKGFDTNIITPMTTEEKEYLVEYSARTHDKDITNNP